MSLYRAKETLRYYLRHAWTAAGLEWTSDNEVEAGEIIEEIADEIAGLQGQVSEMKEAKP